MTTKLTRKQAIVTCKELWEDIKTSGLSKVDYFDTHKELRGKWNCNCPLCEWTDKGKAKIGGTLCPRTTRVCPLIKQYHSTCYALGFADKNGEELADQIPSKKWLKVIEELKEE